MNVKYISIRIQILDVLVSVCADNSAVTTSSINGSNRKLQNI